MANENLINKAVEIGTREFQVQNYSRALKIYTRGIEECKIYYTESEEHGRRRTNRYHSKYKALLDCRAACFGKLDRLDKSLEDSETLISLDHYSIKGYLRKGKILCKTNREREAFESINDGINVLRHGIFKYKSKLKINKRLYTKMRNERARLAEHLGYEIVRDADGKETKKRKQSSSDPVVKLPVEIIMEVMSLLDQSDVLSAMAVSRQWHLLLTSITEIVECPTLKKRLTREQFEKFLDFCHDRIHIKKLCLDCKPVDEIYILTRLANSGIVTENLEITLRNVTDENLAKLLGQNVHARELFQSLRQLKLALEVYDVENGINNIMAYLTRLETLSITVLNVRKSLTIRQGASINAVARNYANKFHKLSELQLHFHLGDPKGQTNTSLYNNFFRMNHFSRLTDLELNCSSYDRASIKELLERNYSLKRLALYSISPNEISWIFRAISEARIRLETFEIQEVCTKRRQQEEPIEGQDEMDLSFLSELKNLTLIKTSITVRSLVQILEATNMQLQVLKLVENDFIAFGPGPIHQFAPYVIFPLEQLVRNCPNLKSLSLMRCSNLDNASIRMLSKLIEKYSQPRKLERLDLSYNNIDGLALVALFGPNSLLRLRTLLVTGCDISLETLTYVKRKGFVEHIVM
ncbi:hypothetical protein FOA43_003480 [Brettanomyces nanus]|uniref:F-box domain-containing protein n=1 Tax=Eeniella nana TaxID=13502 RepID=A0A875SAW9_EENNA|nr:uncharacterized protein FOA43_003480 [Brettanomyces nanus]QPG76094.1 hypothetical protein FOA43_003480 [Brettanomyces nanus]